MRTKDLIINNTTLSSVDVSFILDSIKEKKDTLTIGEKETILLEYLKKKYRVEITYFKKYTKIQIDYDIVTKEEYNLTDKETLFLSDLKDFYKENGYFPSVRELCAYMGFSSPSTIMYYYNVLEEKKKIKRVNNRKIIFLEDK